MATHVTAHYVRVTRANTFSTTLNAARLPFAELTSLVATRLLPSITMPHQYYWFNGGWLGDEFGFATPA